MRCPFPGMDPYLEDPAIWPDFHARMVNALCDTLLDRLPPGYDARIDERVRLVIPEGPARTRFPDVGITRRSDAPLASAPAPSPTALMEPVELPEAEPVRTYYVRVVHGPERDLVTTIELLSPANKSGVGLAEYEERRAELIRAGVHVVELNLLVGGDRPALQSDWPAGDYYAMVIRSGRKPAAGVTAWSVRSPLPTVPVPLRAPDPDVPLDVQEALEQVYSDGRYMRRVRYDEPCQPPLSPVDQQWANERWASYRAARTDLFPRADA